MKAIIILTAISLSLNDPIKDLFSLKKYDVVIDKVNSKSSVEDKTFKVYSLFYLNNFNDCYELGNSITAENKSDSLKYVLAKSAYYLNKDSEFSSIVNSMSSETLKNELNSIYEYTDMSDFFKSADFKKQNNQGFTFVSNDIVTAEGNMLYLNGVSIYEGPGKYVCYPYYDQASNQVYFSANMYDGRDLNPGDFDKISRDRISKLQLFRGNYKNGKLTDVESLNFTSREHDYITPFLIGEDLYFASNVIGGMGGYDLYRTSFNKLTGNWETPVNLGPSFNSKYNETGYFEVNNKAYFSSENNTAGKLDLFTCMKNSRLYFNFINLGNGVNTRFSEFNLVVKDNKGYYSSMNEKGVVEIRIIDELTKSKRSKIHALNAEDNSSVIVDTMTIDYSNGVNEKQSIGDSILNIDVNQVYKSEYLFDAYGFEPTKVSADDAVSLNDQSLKFKPVFAGVIEDYITGEPIKGVKVFAIKGDDTITHISDENGKWWHAVEENDGWKIVFDKSGYKNKSIDGDKLKAAALKNMSMGIDTKKGTKLEIRNIYFAYGKAELQKESEEVLNRIVDYMNENPTVRFELSAHTDSRGSDPVNMKLSTNRSMSAYNYLIGKGISKSRLVPKGYGESKPVNKCTNGSKCTEEEFQLNRRVEIVIL